MKETKKHSNLLKILDLIIRKGSLSRVDLTKETGLTRAAVGQLAEELLHKGLIREAGIGETRGGRPPTLLEPVPEGCCFIGAGMFDASWSLVLMDLSGAIVDQRIRPIGEMTPAAAAEALCGGIADLREAHREKRLLPRVGIGAPGLVDTGTGTIVSAVDVRWREIPLGEMVRDLTGLPSTVVNRSKVSALASYYLDNPDNKGNILSIVIGTGVASGMILEHRLFMGSTFGAGELGHTSIIPNGPLCRCGNRGCLQALIGEDAILDRGRNLAQVQGKPLPATVQEIFSRSSEGEFYHRVIEEAAEYLSIALGNMINLLNPDLVVLSGPMISGCEGFSEMVIRKNRYRAMGHNLRAARVVSSEWGIRTAAMGSALLVRESTEEILSCL